LGPISFVLDPDIVEFQEELFDHSALLTRTLTRKNTPFLGWLEFLLSELDLWGLIWKVSAQGLFRAKTHGQPHSGQSFKLPKYGMMVLFRSGILYRRWKNPWPPISNLNAHWVQWSWSGQSLKNWPFDGDFAFYIKFWMVLKFFQFLQKLNNLCVQCPKSNW
jgi:hypothetical protein